MSGIIVIIAIILFVVSMIILSKNIDRRTLHKVYVGLRAIGLDARKLERGRLEEDIARGSQKSLGLIEIQGRSIRLVNVLKAETSGGSNNPGSVDYSNVYLVPDPVMGLQKLKLKSVRVRSVPVVGRVVDLHWKGNFKGNHISRLGQDVSLNQTLIRLKEDIEICSHPDHGCWSILSSRSSTGNFPWVFFGHPAPSREQWDCYETIASHLLKVSHGWRTERPMDDKVYDVCPRCSSSNINKAIKRLPKSQQEIEALGFKAEWDCLCFDCQFEWVEREKP